MPVKGLKSVKLETCTNCPLMKPVNINCVCLLAFYVCLLKSDSLIRWYLSFTNC